MYRLMHCSLAIRRPTDQHDLHKAVCLKYRSHGMLVLSCPVMASYDIIDVKSCSMPSSCIPQGAPAL